MRQDRIDRHAAGYLAGIAAPHAVADNVESQRRIRTEAVFVVGAFASDVGLGAVERFDRQERFLLRPRDCADRHGGLEQTLLRCDSAEAGLSVARGY